VQTLAVSIFTVHAPSDPATLPEPYLKCLELGRTYRACVISGRSFTLCEDHCVLCLYSPSLRAIQDSPAHSCKTCRHPLLENEVDKLLLQAPHPPAQLGLGMLADNGGRKELNCPLCHFRQAFSAIPASSQPSHNPRGGFK